jgi:hypothetical protein
MKKLSENTYSHKGYTIIKTESTTVSVMNWNRLRSVIQHVYKIENMKNEGTLPFITSLAEAKQYIDKQLSNEEL